jgi:hypothetical protein
MKRAQKKIFGFLGLIFVIVTTIIAAKIPAPVASAISSVTDTIVVTVVGSVPDVNVSGITNGEATLEPNAVTVSYENVTNVEVSAKYTNADGITISKVIDSFPSSYGHDAKSYDLFGADAGLLGAGFGYGKYVINVKGTNESGVYDEDLVSFEYLPLVAELEEDEDTGKIYTDLEYNADDGTEDSDGDVAKIIINVYDKDGNLVEGLSPIEVTPPTTKVELPFEKYNVPSGRYTIAITSYDRDNNKLYKPYILTLDYEAVIVPNTGGFFRELNISKEDYLVTGLLVFFIVGVVALGIILKDGKKKSHKR